MNVHGKHAPFIIKPRQSQARNPARERSPLLCSREKGTTLAACSSPLLGRKEMATTRALVLAVAVLAASLLAAGTAAQSMDAPAECANKLVGCAAYMNGTDAETPPDTCCGPLRDAVKNEKPCLCALYASPEIFKAFHINLTDALRLSKRCGISEDTSSCPSNSPSSSPPGSPSSGNNAGQRTVSTSFAGLMSLFLVLWSVLA
uniref:Uncharacterized protein n=1 Tax=Avena sativa TaxID=4498 RepID=A0ACD5UH66_AVESA